MMPLLQRQVHLKVGFFHFSFNFTFCAFFLWKQLICPVMLQHHIFIHFCHVFFVRFLCVATIFDSRKVSVGAWRRHPNVYACRLYVLFLFYFTSDHMKNLRGLSSKGIKRDMRTYDVNHFHRYLSSFISKTFLKH